MQDISSFYIKYPGHPYYSSERLETDDPIDLIIDKFEMIFFTNKGEVLGDENFGGNVSKYLWQTNFSADKLKEELIEQAMLYIPELSPSSYKIDVYLMQGTERDIGVIETFVEGYTIRALFT